MNKTLMLSMLLIPLFSSCSFDKEMKKIEQKAANINKYENVALKLASENRQLRAEVKRLEFEVQKLKQDKMFQLGKLEESKKEGTGRSIASVKAGPLVVAKDLVEYKTYKWTAEDMLKIADKEFKAENYEKAAQFYTSLINYYPTFKGLNDELLYKAGISAYESGEHHDWTLTHFEALMTKYPTSEYFRSAKLWVGLTHMKLGEKDKFFKTVEEFRKRYRNTNEWKILRSYYENIEEKSNE